MYTVFRIVETDIIKISMIGTFGTGKTFAVSFRLNISCGHVFNITVLIEMSTSIIFCRIKI